MDGRKPLPQDKRNKFLGPDRVIIIPTSTQLEQAQHFAESPVALYADESFLMFGLQRLGLGQSRQQESWDMAYLSKKSSGNDGLIVSMDAEAYRQMARDWTNILLNPEEARNKLDYSPESYRKTIEDKGSNLFHAVSNMVDQAHFSNDELKGLMTTAARNEQYAVAALIRDKLKARELPNDSAIPEKTIAMVRNAAFEDMPVHGAKRLILAAKITGPEVSGIDADALYPIKHSQISTSTMPNQFAPENYVSFDIPQRALCSLVTSPAITDGANYVHLAMQELIEDPSQYQIAQLSKNGQKAGIRVAVQEDAFREMSRKAALIMADRQAGSALLGYKYDEYTRLMNDPRSEPLSTAINAVSQAKMQMRDLKSVISSARTQRLDMYADAVDAMIAEARTTLGCPPGPRDR